MNKNNKRVSLSQIYTRMILIMIPVLIIGTITAYSLGKDIQRQALRLLRGNMDTQVENLEETYNNINYSLMSALNSNENLNMMNDTKDTIKKVYAINELKKDLSDFRYYFDSKYNFFTYDSEKKKIYELTPDNLNYTSYSMIKEALATYLSQNNKETFATANRKWNLITTPKGVSILVKSYMSQGKTLGCWIQMDDVKQMFKVNQYSDKNNYLFLIKDGQVLTDSHLFERISKGEGVDAFIHKSGQKLKGYDVYLYEFNKGSFSILSIINATGNYNGNIKVLYVFVFLLSVVIGVGFLLLYYIRVRLIKPIYTLMDRLQDSDKLDVSKQELKLFEFRQADELFRKAKQQIKELKITIYEKEIQKQKLQQDFHQVQIRPHFYLNCLNIIYNMAQSKRFEEIQELSMEVSNYMRTLIGSGMDRIRIKDEIEHLKGYLNIQEFRYSNDFTYDIHVEDEVLNYKILPLIIHTIVENSIKHTIMKGTIVHIDISITKVYIDGKAYIKILVWDTGEGFSKEILEELRSRQKLETREGYRIGLNNMIQRLKYVYKNQVAILFDNIEKGGARVEITVPVVLQEDQE